MEQSRLIILLIKRRQEQLSLAEQKELSSLLQIEPDAAKIEGAVNDILESRISFDYAISDEFVLRSAEKLQHWIALSPVRDVKGMWMKSYFPRTFAIAASLILIAVAAWIFVQYNRSSAPVQNIVATQKGSKSSVTLPDGTKVWINADTRLTYDKNFGEKTRVVNLEGEAYFDVSKDESRPFIVHTKTLDVKVLGTRFNVRAYKTEASTETTLISGMVEIELKKKNIEKFTLKPSEKIIVQNGGPLYPQLSDSNKTTTRGIVLSAIKSTLPDSEAVEIQWVKNKLVFDHQKLKDIIPIIERWYNVSFIINRKQLPETTFSGTFENDNLNDVLQSLKLSAGTNYSILKDKVIIY